MHIRTKFGTVAAALVATAALASQSWAAPTAAEILSKSTAAMKSAKTYQGTWLMSTSMGTMGSMQLQMNIKAIGDKKMRMSMSPIGKPTGMMAMGASMATMEMVSDGTNTWMYMPAMKTYQKMPSRGTSGSPMDMAKSMQNDKNTTFTYLGTESVGGKPAYVLQAKPKAPKGPAANQKIKLYFDQSTYRFRQMKMEGTAPAQGGAPQPMVMTMMVQSEKVNQPIPDSVFKFTPPPGATEGKGGMMGGMPMGGGRK